MSTPNDSTLRTGWVCIATEGTTVDDREITAAWLTDMAETYDPSYYTALIWPDHDRWFNFGYVQELKTESVDGKLKLFAILSPTRDLIYYNQTGQYQFCSIEPQEQFADLGRTYLRGLGVTDEPASTGTTHLKFKDGRSASHLIGRSEPLDLSMFQLPRHEKADGLLKKFFNFLASHGEELEPISQPPRQEDEAMNTEQFNQMLGALTGLGGKLDTLASKVETFSAKPADEKPAEPAGTTEQPKPNEPATINAEQFNKLEQALTGMVGKLDSLTQTIEQFSAEKPGQRPDLLGGDDLPSPV